MCGKMKWRLMFEVSSDVGTSAVAAIRVYFAISMQELKYTVTAIPGWSQALGAVQMLRIGGGFWSLQYNGAG